MLLRSHNDKAMNQTQKILNHLRTGQRISPMQALEWYGVMRLAARIIELRRAGHEIATEMRVTGKGGRYATYRLIKEAK